MIINIKYIFFMIICLCNNISNAEIDEAINRGSLTIRQVYDFCGCKPRCGSCKDFIEEQIKLKAKETEEV